MFAKLARATDYKVVVVQGGAGSGKSTLLASFIHEGKHSGGVPDGYSPGSGVQDSDVQDGYSPGSGDPQDGCVPDGYSPGGGCPQDGGVPDVYSPGSGDPQDGCVPDGLAHNGFTQDGGGRNNWKWITLDKENNDPFSFWHYMLTVLYDELGAQGEHILSSFDAMVQQQELEKIVAILVNALEPTGHLTIVLDDFHHIDDPLLLYTLQFFLKYSSPNIHLVLVTREEPNVYLGDLTIAGQVMEIGEEELKLSPAEADAFLQHTLQIDVVGETAEKMKQLSEGWVGGLQLIALAMANKNRTPMREISGLNKHVGEYLSNEILSSVDRDERHFLIRTSILSYFDATVCNSLLQRTDAQRLLDRLTQKNLFLVTVDEKNSIYRYHYLFCEFLQLKFTELDTLEQQVLRERAARAYEKAGDLEESVRHFFACDNYTEALRLIGNMRHPVTAWTYLKQVPPAEILDNKEMMFQRLFYHYCHLELEQVQTLLHALNDKIDSDPAWRLFGFFRLLIDDRQTYGDYGRVSDLSFFRDVEQMAFNDVTKALVYLTSATVLNFLNQYDETLALIDRAAQIERRLHNPYIRFFVLNLTAQVKETLGALTECTALYDAIFRLVEKYPFLVPLHGNSALGVVGVHLLRMELDEADRYLRQVATLLDSNYPSMAHAYLHNKVEYYLLRGEARAAKDSLNELATHPVYRERPYNASLLTFQFYVDDVDPNLVATFQHTFAGNRQHATFAEKLTYSHVLFSQGERQQALMTVDEVLQKCRKGGIRLPLIEALLLKIAILETEGTAASAALANRRTEKEARRHILNLLQEAIHYSFADRILAPFVLTGGATLTPYLTQLKTERAPDLSTGEKRYIDEILTLFGQKSTPNLLSQREMEVMQVLATGASNREIGEQLYISLATVKSHVINIYSKLHVSNRVEAVEKARQMGIIS
ncbi:LuxR C-terminal-related transcriptional regulator [Numidum massiliense]|uniref:LuxR C-terminal-related transcriptional regulator n=1 Tax=Numidum massiliense TaxID=1522315 RepID=UPI00164E0A1A|nr:LuxR C-terminal-related transcriptional regulator [Numidum massiliense]